MLGVTLGPATGEALAPLVLEDRLVDALVPLTPGRFS
jgi:glycine/D-amino acid oxidase-like deaminating enzyme